MSLGYTRMKRTGKGAGRALAYKERRGDDFTAGAFEVPQAPSETGRPLPPCFPGAFTVLHESFRDAAPPPKAAQVR